MPCSLAFFPEHDAIDVDILVHLLIPYPVQMLRGKNLRVVDDILFELRKCPEIVKVFLPGNLTGNAGGALSVKIENLIQHTNHFALIQNLIHDGDILIDTPHRKPQVLPERCLIEFVPADAVDFSLCKSSKRSLPVVHAFPDLRSYLLVAPEDHPAFCHDIRASAHDQWSAGFSFRIHQRAKIFRPVRVVRIQINHQFAVHPLQRRIPCRTQTAILLMYHLHPGILRVFVADFSRFIR